MLIENLFYSLEWVHLASALKCWSQLDQSTQWVVCSIHPVTLLLGLGQWPLCWQLFFNWTLSQYNPLWNMGSYNTIQYKVSNNKHKFSIFVFNFIHYLKSNAHALTFFFTWSWLHTHLKSCNLCISLYTLECYWIRISCYLKRIINKMNFLIKPI